MDEEKKNGSPYTVVALVNAENVDRYGSAAAEFLKVLRGVDQETGQVLDRSLRSVAGYAVDADFADRNIDQQAGFSAELAKVAKDNSANIIEGNNVRVSRTEDVAGFGKNHQIADHVEIVEGVVDLSSISQMKFLNDPESFLRKVARGEGGGANDLSRYMEANAIDLPSEQVQQAKTFCREQAQSLREQARAVDERGKADLAERMCRDADRFERLEGKIRDSGLTRDEARAYRLNPEWETVKDIAVTSHRAGLEGAKFGAVIGGTISLVMNSVAVCVGDKEFEDAAWAVIGDTGLAASVGYAGTFTGAATKAYMQQSSSEIVRTLSATALPALAVSCCFAVGASVAAYVSGDLDEAQFMESVGGVVANNVASTFGASLGQMVIPVPVLGAVIGGMVASTLSGIFYQAYFEAGRRADFAEERYQRIKAECEQARALSVAYRRHVEQVVALKLSALHQSRDQLLLIFAQCDEWEDMDAFANSVNQFALGLGTHLEFKSRAEFDRFMEDESSALKF